MRNPFELKEVPGKEAPPGVYGYRPYLLSFCAAWVRSLAYAIRN